MATTGATFSLDVWDPFEGFPFSTSAANLSSSDRETTAIANACIDWKVAHVLDVPGLKKEEVKVEVEDGRILQISGREAKSRRRKMTNGIAWRGAASGEGGNGEWGAHSHCAKGGEVKAIDIST